MAFAPTLRRRIFFYFAGLALLLAILVGTLWDSANTRSRIIVAMARHDTAVVASQELQKTAYDLSRMARTYVMVDDTLFKQRYLAILAIRGGKLPRPANYLYFFWDTASPDIGRGVDTTNTTSLIGLIRQQGLSTDEETILGSIEAHMKTQTRMSDQAIALMDGRYPDAESHFVIQGTPDREGARAILYGQRYAGSTAELLSTIDRLVHQLDGRLADLIADGRAHYTRLWYVDIGLAAFMLLYCLAGWSSFVRSISTPLADLLGTMGDHASSSDTVDEGNEIATLTGIYHSLTQRLTFNVNDLRDIHTELEQRSRDLAKANIALEARTTLVNATLATIAQGVSVFDQDMKLVAWNNQFFQLMNVPSDFASVGTAALDIFQALERNGDLDASQRANIGYSLEQSHAGRAHDFEMLVGNRIVQLRSRPTPDGLIVTTYSDITKDRKNEEELSRTASRLQAVLNNAIDAILTFDETGSIEAFNLSAEKLFGYPAHEILHKSVFSLVSEPYRSESSQALTRYVREGSRNGMGRLRELVCVRRDGSEFPGEISINEFWIGEERRFVGVIRNISERKVVDRMKTEFVSTVSHELRAPLTSIAGSLGLLTGGAAGALSDKARRLVTIAHANSQRLVRLINDILDLDKLDAGKMQFASMPLSIRDIVDASVESSRGFAQEFGVQLVLMPEESTGGTTDVIRGDPDRLTQVFVNLLSNAAKFSPPGATVEASIHRMGDHVRVAIRDYGTGIPEAFQRVIFNRFSQADSSDRRRQGGTGLGLSIAKSIVEHHRGHISFETEIGRGTTFFVDFPISAESAEPLPAPVPALSLDGSAPARAEAVKPGGEPEPEDRPLAQVLHIEDDLDVQDLVRASLAGTAQVTTVSSLEEGRKAIATYGFDLIILDQVLPDGSGLELLPLPKRLDGSAIPIIIFSMKDATPQAMLQVVAALTKSRVGMDQLVERIKSTLAGHDGEAVPPITDGSPLGGSSTTRSSDVPPVS
jgi:PAS domain S-box-containing protein